MDMKRCPNGHFYDASLYRGCPYCQGASANVNLAPGGSFVGRPDPAVSVQQAGGGSQPAPPAGPGNIPVRPAGLGNGFMPPVRPGNVPKQPAGMGNGSMHQGVGRPEQERKTVAVLEQKTGVNPVVGWMVCVDGIEKGKDYSLHSGNNFIGRRKGADICLENDMAVSRENQGVISYDARHKSFYAVPGTGQNLIYLNGEPLLTAHELRVYDRLEMGNTTLMFVPLCGEEFQWDEK